MKELLICSFSGGRTSAFMAYMIKTLPQYKDFDLLFVFANTGKENPETLEFVNKCDVEWGLNVVWLEADIIHEKRKGTEFKIVSYKTAARNGEPFEDMLKKYPMPNNRVSNCTRELKLAPINKYVKSLGYDKTQTAIGIRSDEQHRKSINAKKQNIIYPLCDTIPVDVLFIRKWWDGQKFDLDLKDYDGNCDLCFKKSLKKKLTILKNNPEKGKWWVEMEEKYSTENYPRFDLRTHKTIPELIEMSKEPFQLAVDVHGLTEKQQSLFNFELDCLCKSN